MGMFVDAEDLDTMNLKTLHELTTTQKNTIKFLQHLKLIPIKPNESCTKNCNDWYLGSVANRGDEGIFLKKISMNFLFSLHRIYISM